jgi:hypothetical protein
VSGRRGLAALALTLAVLAPVAGAAPEAPTGTSDLEAARAAQVEAAHRYRESLDALVALHEAAVSRAAAEAERRRSLHAQGLIAAAHVEAAARRLADARETAERTRATVREADALVLEAEAARALALLPPPAPDETQESPALIRHGGRGRFSLAAVPALTSFFAGRFGHALPVSAYGQTPVHDRLGFDHRNALDLAVHPDSAEGRALLDYLRAHGIPFLAFRAAHPGMATGAHIHVGDPSGRLLGLQSPARGGRPAL